MTKDEQSARGGHGVAADHGKFSVPRALELGRERLSAPRRRRTSAWAAQMPWDGFGLRCLIILAVVGWLTSVEAWAHRDRGPDDPCRRQIGDSLLHLTLYQPQFDPAGEYCEEVPRAGKTIMVVDVTAGELRRTPMSLEVIETALSGQSQTVLSLPATDL